MINRCPFCGEPTTLKGGEDWCEPCQFQAWPVREKELTISAAEAKKRWDTRASDKPLLIDVRRLDEYATTNIAGAVFIPMDELVSRFDDIPNDRHIVTYCHHGTRSLFAARLLRQRGYPHVQSMDGGIDAWADLDPAVEKY